MYKLYDWGKVRNFIELHNVTELYVFQNELLTFNNSTTTIVPCCCTLLHSTGSSNSITCEFTCEFQYLMNL